ncbi:hypothetical protein [Gordonia sp. CPCC 205333]|uniref:hypothetical protein n=1 Tax=Gordonia sp. CPCC 205333 TaxID=3140790 RepID=UPI003AF372D8
MRHSIFRDLDANSRLVGVVEAFLAGVDETRRLMALSAKVHNRFEAMGWHLAAAESYLGVVQRFVAGFIAAQPQSASLSELTSRLSGYIGQGNHAAPDPFSTRFAGLIWWDRGRWRRVAVRICIERFSALTCRPDEFYARCNLRSGGVISGIL